MNAATLTYLSINDRIYKVSSQRILRVIEVPLRTRCPKFSESVTRLWRSVLCLPRSRSRILQIGPCGRSWCATLGTLSLLMDLSDCQLDQLSDDFLHCLMPRPICHATRVSLIIPASSHDRHRMRADFHGRSVSLSSCPYVHIKSAPTAPRPSLPTPPRELREKMPRGASCIFVNCLALFYPNVSLKSLLQSHQYAGLQTNSLIFLMG